MLVFRSVRYKNFLSTGNTFNEIDLNSAKTNLIIGKNGAGKSTMIDALCFSLYNKPFRKINKPQLINSVNGKGLIAEVEFATGGREYKVVRGVKPNKFEIYIDGELKNQESKSGYDQTWLEQNVLKMNHKSFGQIVVLGSSTFTPFLQLSAGDRRAVIEDLLDIQVFTKMNSVLKERVSENNSALKDASVDVDNFAREFKRAKDHNAEIRDMKAVEVDRINSEIAEARQAIQYHTDERDRLQAETQALQDTVSDRSKVEQRRDKLRSYDSQIKTKKQQAQKESRFYEDHDSCPTCNQEIDSDFKQQIITKNSEKIEELDDGLEKLVDRVKDCEDRLKEIHSTMNEIGELQQEVSSNLSSIQIYERSIRKLESELEGAKKQASEVDESEIRELSQKLETAKAEKERLEAEATKLKVAANVLKDNGVKAQMIKRYIPKMNESINQHLAAMNFFVQFELDENFNEHIRTKSKEGYSYTSFSEGEKLRIDLALLFTWRRIANARNSVTTNILFMDEILDSSLDMEGTDDFLKIITDLTQGTNIFIISHKGEEFQDKFDNLIVMNKAKGFSYVEA